MVQWLRLHVSSAGSTDLILDQVTKIPNTAQHSQKKKKNEIVPFAERWINLDTVIQSKVSRKKKNKYHMLTHICGI